MKLSTELQEKGFHLYNVMKEDLQDFICIEKVSHYKYVKQHKDFFGDWNETILREAFLNKMNMAYFEKIIWKEETVGFVGYDLMENAIDKVFIRLVPEAQNQGLGTWFLNELKEISANTGKPVLLAVIQTNPAKLLYKKEGFQCYNKKDVFEFYKYESYRGKEYTTDDGLGIAAF